MLWEIWLVSARTGECLLWKGLLDFDLAVETVETIASSWDGDGWFPLLLPSSLSFQPLMVIRQSAA